MFCEKYYLEEMLEVANRVFNRFGGTEKICWAYSYAYGRRHNCSPENIFPLVYEVVDRYIMEKD